MSENNTTSGLKEMLLLLIAIPAMAGVLIGPIMIFWPVFLVGEWLTAGVIGTAPTLMDWVVSPLVSVAGVLITYAVFRILIEIERVEGQQSTMGAGYVKALEDGEINGFLYVCNLLISWELAKKALMNRTPDGEADG